MSIANCPSTTLQVALLTTSAELDGVAEEWNRLAADIPFRGAVWLSAWWRHYCQGDDRLFTLAVRDCAGELVGLAPWYLSHSPGGQLTVRFLGSEEVCSDYLSILCRTPLEFQVTEALARWLAGDAGGEWDLLELTGVERSDGPVSQLARHLADFGHTVHQRPDLSCWRIELPDDWDQYLAILSSSRRSRMRKLYRENFESGRVVLHRAVSEAELERGFEILVDLHQKRRNSLSEHGCFASERFSSFHRDVAERLRCAGRLRLLWTELEGQPMTAEYGLVNNDTVFYYQAGFDPRFASEQPGYVALAGSLKQAIDEGYRCFDLLRGDEPYKASLGAVDRPLMQIRVVGRRPAARMRHAAWQTSQAMKQWARQGLKLTQRWKSQERSQDTRG